MRLPHFTITLKAIWRLWATSIAFHDIADPLWRLNASLWVNRNEPKRPFLSALSCKLRDEGVALPNGHRKRKKIAQIS